MKRKLQLKQVKWFLMIVLISNTSLQSYAQAQTITGRVIGDDNNEGLPAVSVLLKGTQKGVLTGNDGTFIIDVPNGDGILVFSFIGYQTQELQIGNRSKIDVSLMVDDQQLDEIVVVGYGTVKKSDLTGSVVSLKAKELTPGANASVDQMMQGRAAGVVISQKSGEPGSALSVNIRGASSISAGNEPLYVIDGMPINNGNLISGSGGGMVANPNPRNPLNSINPNDIESIEILKDASATAIYGSRGSNGVVMITTKQGTVGKMKVSYDGYYGTQQVANSLRMLTAQEYQSSVNAIIDAGGGPAGERVNEIQNGGTDWQSLLFEDAAVMNHDISFSGGNAKSKYFVSLNAFDQDGVIKNSGMKRYATRINVENGVAQKYRFGINLSASYINDKFASVGTGVNENAGANYAAAWYDPSLSIYNADGGYNRSPFITTDNPLALLEGESAYSETTRTFGTVFGEYFLLPELSAKVKISGDISNSQRDTWVDPITLEGEQNGGIATINSAGRSYYLTEGTLNYNKTIGQHSFNGLGGATFERFYSKGFSAQGRGFALSDLKTNALGTGNAVLNQIGSGRQDATLVSFLGRLNYGFKDTYLLTATFRADGSSRFGPNNKFGYFPTVAAAWKMQNESFMQNQNLFSELKLRGSYGTIGNQSIANYLYVTSFEFGNDAVYGSDRYQSINPSRLSNPDLKWESANQLDLGIDFALLSNRLTGTLGYYNRKTTDLLMNVPKPLSTGFGGRIENVGSMKNSGVEFTLNGTVINNMKSDFRWNTSINFTTINNEVVEIGGGDEILTGGIGFLNGVTIIKPGLPLNTYYGYETNGVWQADDDLSVTNDNVAPGDLRFVDQNDDGTINADDRVVLGKAFPDFTWGLSNDLSYKGFTFSVFLQGVQGISLLNNNLVDTYFPIQLRRNRVAEPVLNRWTPENPSEIYPSLVNPLAQGQRVVNSLTVEDASFVRLQSIRLGYNIPLNNKFINAASIYVSGNNLKTFTKYSGVDPTSNSNGSDFVKIDYNAYPMTKSFLFGVNLQF